MSNRITELTSAISVVPAIPTGPLTNGHKPPAYGDGKEPEPSTYLDLLPAIYSMDTFVGRFLRIFEEVLDPISVMVDNQPYYFDPMTAPLDLLEYMAIWVDLDEEGEDWPLPKRRALIGATAALYRLRGTKAGLKRHLGIYAGGAPFIQERTNGFRLDPDARLGLNTSIGEERQHVFTVTIAVPDPRELDTDTLKSIIEADKPVETSYILRVVQLDINKEKKRGRAAR